MFQVNNRNTRERWKKVNNQNTRTFFTKPFSDVSIVNTEQVNAIWVEGAIREIMMKAKRCSVGDNSFTITVGENFRKTY